MFPTTKINPRISNNTPKNLKLSILLMLVSCAFPTMLLAQSGEIKMFPAKDNTLIETPLGNSNGSADFFFAGKTGSTFSLRRGLLQFDVANTIPANAIIDSVTLEVYMDQSSNDTVRTFTIHQVLQDWGEDSSALNGGVGDTAMGIDATWEDAFLDSISWNIPGGDFDTTLLTSSNIGSPGSYGFSSTPTFVDMVQYWRENPDSNFGLIILGDENINGSVKRFGSRENPDSNQRPVLRIFYSTEDTLGTQITTKMKPVSVYPIPAAEQVYLRNIEGKNPTCNIIDAQGKIVLNQDQIELIILDSTFIVNVKSLISGVYFLQISTSKRNYTQKIVVSHE